MLATLLAHLAWADARARDALQTIPPDAPERARAVAIYAHVAAAEHVWAARLEGRAPAHAVWPALELDAAGALAAYSAAVLARLAATCTPEQLAADVVYRTSAGEEFRNRVEDVLVHVALHGSYHRGQLALLATRGGGEAAATDYVVYLRGAGAAR